jgi:UDP-N-acetylmuramoyl-L-alanyl-D-glutamate--2,6-diaminopimelate ligase
MWQEAAIMMRTNDREWSDPQGVRLADLFPDARFIACDDVLALRCTADADDCGPGDVFVAHVTGLGDVDHDVARAVASGASAIVAEQMMATGDVPLCLVQDAAWAHARLCHALAGDPAAALRLIAITGTSGKTTTAWLTASVLAEAGLRVGVVSDLGCLDGEGLEAVAGPIEEPAAVAACLARIAESGCTHAVIEVSSRMLAMHALAGVACETVAVTNLATAHLDQHGSRDAYHEIKGRILDCLAADGVLIVNGDDHRLERLARRRLQQRDDATILRAGLTGGDLTATPIERSLFGQTVLLEAAGQSMPLAVGTPVASFIRDALVAAAVGARYGVPLDVAARGIEAAGSVAGRMERLDRGQDFATFLDRPTCGHALASSLSGLRRLTRGRLVVIAEHGLADALGGRRFASRAARWCDECVVAPDSIAADEADDAAIAAYAKVDRLLASLGDGDCLLILGDVPDDDPSHGEPCGGRIPLARVVDGWLQLAHPPRRVSGGRRAA